MKTAREMRQGATRTQLRELIVAPFEGGYRAELWYRPFSGWMLACTMKRSTRSWARRDGLRLLKYNVVIND